MSVLKLPAAVPFWNCHWQWNTSRCSSSSKIFSNRYDPTTSNVAFYTQLLTAYSTAQEDTVRTSPYPSGQNVSD
ncbi:hypothetical protein QCA50_003332 [Cerrena zonata]|uniref:Uncharacterized protein n=1 Tax=Cerrena zonata TaxID=2478898 RepID=A0AAW0GW52_9APHY